MVQDALETKYGWNTYWNIFSVETAEEKELLWYAEYSAHRVRLKQQRELEKQHRQELQAMFATK